MGDFTTRLGCTLRFDDKKEPEVVELVTRLQNSRKIGEFLCHLLRLASENPSIIDTQSSRKSYGPLLQEMNRLGVTPDKAAYIKKAESEISDMKRKVDEIYQMCKKMYCLAEIGKRLNLQERSNNILMSSFILEYELTKLKATLGIDTLDSPFASSKKNDTEAAVSDILEYIITAYSGICEEIKLVGGNAVTSVITSEITPVTSNESAMGLGQNPVADIVDKNLEKKQEVSDGVTTVMNNKFDEGNPEEDDVIDFDDANLDMLSTFFND